MGTAWRRPEEALVGRAVLIASRAPGQKVMGSGEADGRASEAGGVAVQRGKRGRGCEGRGREKLKEADATRAAAAIRRGSLGD